MSETFDHLVDSRHGCATYYGVSRSGCDGVGYATVVEEIEIVRVVCRNRLNLQVRQSSNVRLAVVCSIVPRIGVVWYATVWYVTGGKCRSSHHHKQTKDWKGE